MSKTPDSLLNHHTVLWVEDWPLKDFFLRKHLASSEAKTREEKMEIVWSLIQKMMLAREALNQQLQSDPKEIETELENLLKSKEIRSALKTGQINKEELFQFLEIEKLGDLFLAQLEKQVKDYLEQHPGLIQDLYEKNKPVLLNAHRLAQVHFPKSAHLDENRSYTSSEIIDLQGKILDLGLFSEEEILRHYPQDEYPILGKPAGNLILADTAEQEIIYYWIQEIIPEMIKEFSDVKVEFENFVLSYMTEETLSDLYHQLMDHYEIRYNESYFQQFMQE